MKKLLDNSFLTRFYPGNGSLQPERIFSPKDDSSPTSSEIDDFFFPQTVQSATENWTAEYASDPSVWEQRFKAHLNLLERLLGQESYDKRLLTSVSHYIRLFLLRKF